MLATIIEGIRAIKARLMDLTDRVVFVPEVLYLWRETEGSVSSSARAKVSQKPEGR